MQRSINKLIIQILRAIASNSTNSYGTNKSVILMYIS